MDTKTQPTIWGIPDDVWTIIEPTLLQPTEERPQHLCLDNGDDHLTGHETVATDQCTPDIRHIGEEKRDPTGQKTYPARRWVVERTLA